MNVKIYYCGEWDYLPQASRLEGELKNSFKAVQVELIVSSGGDFKVIVDDKIVYDKLSMPKYEARFPNESEISSKIRKF